MGENKICFQCIHCEMTIGNRSGYDFTVIKQRRSARKQIRNHFASSSHDANTFFSKSRVTETRKAWTTLVNVFLDNITEPGFSDLKFERMVYKEYRKGAPVGNRYHTKKTVNKLLAEAHEIVNVLSVSTF